LAHIPGLWQGLNSLLLFSSPSFYSFSCCLSSFEDDWSSFSPDLSFHLPDSARPPAFSLPFSRTQRFGTPFSFLNDFFLSFWSTPRTHPNTSVDLVNALGDGRVYPFLPRPLAFFPFFLRLLHLPGSPFGVVPKHHVMFAKLYHFMSEDSSLLSISFRGEFCCPPLKAFIKCCVIYVTG